jgi:hypothetical protein
MLGLFQAPQAGSASRNFLPSVVKLSFRPVCVNKKAIMQMMVPVSLFRFSRNLHFIPSSPDC